MMKALGNYILAGRYKAVGIISLLTILSLLIPPFSYIIGGAPYGLVVLRKGAMEALRLLLVLVIVVSVFGYFSRIGFGLGVAFLTSVWLPILLVAQVLRTTESQGLAVLVAGAIGMAFVVILSFFTGEIAAWWQAWMDSLLQQNFSATELEDIQQVLDGLLPMISGIISAGMVLSLILTTLVARSWQAALFNPGGFRDEFHRLALPRWLAIASFACLLGSFLDLGAFSWLLRNCLAVLIVLHVFQGIAAVHRTVFRKGLSRNWLVLMYCFLLFLPQLALFLACLGIADALNQRDKSPSGEGD